MPEPTKKMLQNYIDSMACNIFLIVHRILPNGASEFFYEKFPVDYFNKTSEIDVFLSSASDEEFSKEFSRRWSLSNKTPEKQKQFKQIMQLDSLIQSDTQRQL